MTTDIITDVSSGDPPSAVVRHRHLPGVYPRQSDSDMLVRAGEEELRRRCGPVRVLELGVGNGAVAVRLASCPSVEVTGVDVSRRALATTWGHAWHQGRSLRLLRGDLAGPVRGERFDVVVANPPYVPSESASPPRRGRGRAWDAGLDGRHVVDRIIDLVPRILAPGGALVLVHSALSDLDRTRHRLREQGLVVDEVARSVQPLGPVLRERSTMLRRRGFLADDQHTEEIAAFRAVLPDVGSS